MNKKKWNQIWINIMTYSILFSTGIQQCVYATGEEEVDNVLIEITQILLVIGGLLCIGKLIQIGIMYMMVSVEQKSQAKTAILPWLIGAIVCFGANWLGRTIINIVAGDNLDRDVLSY